MHSGAAIHIFVNVAANPQTANKIIDLFRFQNRECRDLLSPFRRYLKLLLKMEGNKKKLCLAR